VIKHTLFWYLTTFNDRFEIGVVAGSNTVTYVKNHFKDSLHALYKFFDNSAARTWRLRALQKEFDDDELKLAKVGDTRWLR
jgi:hypothetical protein